MHNYYAKFNEVGERETSIALGVHFDTEEQLQLYLDRGFVPITDEEQAIYATNEYIRGADGTPQKKPPYVPTVEDKANQIAAQYEAQIATLKDALATAMLANDEQEIGELKDEYNALLAEYQKELEDLEND